MKIKKESDYSDYSLEGAIPLPGVRICYPGAAIYKRCYSLTTEIVLSNEIF